MKKIKLLLLICLFGANSQFAEVKRSTNSSSIAPSIGWNLSFRGGFDAFVWYKVNNPFVKYKGGGMVGMSLDYYWSQWGAGADNDFIWNKTRNLYSVTTPLNYMGIPLNNFKITENGINRWFVGVGPSFKTSLSSKLALEMKLRGGISGVNGGLVKVESIAPNIDLHYHGGFNTNNSPAGKISAQLNYNVSPRLSLLAGAYYLRHFKVKELNNPATGNSYGYYNKTSSSRGDSISRSSLVVRNSCNCDVSSVGFYVGVNINFLANAKTPKKPKTKKTKKCECCEKCPINITAKDKISGQLIENADVVILDENGKVVGSGKTNGFGALTISGLNEGNYTIKSKIYGNNLIDETITKADYVNCVKNGGVFKDIYYTNTNFIVRGKVMECNSTKTIEGVNVVLKNKNIASVDNTISDNEGNYQFSVLQNTLYTLKGNKDGYFSNIVELNTQEFDRTKTLFIDFKMCVDPCGKAIRLNNINFNLDKWDILASSHSDLDYLVNLMINNPGIKVEMSSHTDCRGSNEYNMDLSQKRANATVQYLISKGISSDRLIARGAGETELLNRCADGVSCSEDEHKINRRTEFKVICVK